MSYLINFKSKDNVLIHSVECETFDDLSSVCLATEVAIIDLKDKQVIGKARLHGLRGAAIQVLKHINKKV